MDWLKRLFADPATIGIIVTSAVVGLVGGSLAGLGQYRHGGLSGLLRAALIGVFVAIIVGLGVSDYISSETAKLAIVGGCAAIGEDIWEGMKAFGRGVRSDPLGYLSRLLDAMRGKIQPKDGP